YGGVWVVIIGDHSAGYTIQPPGPDTLAAATEYGGSANDRLYAGTRTAHLYGMDGNDTLLGGPASDVLDGGPGDDVLNGGPGNDILTGGAGSDTFVHTTGGGADLITDFVPGGNGDKIALTNVSSVYDLSSLLGHATQAGADTVIDFGNGDTITLQNVTKS